MTGPLWALVAALCAAGCASSEQLPHTRLGSIPFPGLFTLYETADPAKLGPHYYEPWWARLGRPGECGRGIMYTCRAGFLDLSHLREYTDWVKYLHDHARLALEGGPKQFGFEWSDARYDVEVVKPDWWATLSDTERATLTEEASICFAQRFVVVLGTWHELGTWYGQETIPGISEQGSALTWDDTTSHVVAAIVGGRALRTPDVPWNDAVANAMDATLTELGAVSEDVEAKAVQRVKGIWWKDGVAIRRDLDTGLGTGVKHPWTVPGLEGCVGAAGVWPGEGVSGGEAAALVVVGLDDVCGRDLRGVFEFTIKPEPRVMRHALGCAECPKTLDSEAEVLGVIERMRAEIKAKWGPDADHP